MSLPAGAKCVKYLVFIFNFLFFVCGLGLVAAGVFVQLKVGDLADLQTVKYLTVPILIIAVGAAIALVSFFGCFGAVKENRCLLCLFFVIVLLVLCAEASGTAMGYIYRGQIETKLRGDLNSSLIAYGQDNYGHITKAFDILQKQEKCCGVNNYTDWQISLYSHGNHSIVPDSCCITYSWKCGKPFVKDDIYEEGCLSKIRQFLKSKLMIIIGAGVGVAVIQLLALIFAMVLICKINKDSVEVFA